MKNTGSYSGMHRGIVISNNDPLGMGRLQIFIPGVHKMPSVWTDTVQTDDRDGVEGEGVINKRFIFPSGSNDIASSMTPEVIERLKQTLPWAEQASPIAGASSPGRFHAPTQTSFTNDSNMIPPGYTHTQPLEVEDIGTPPPLNTSALDKNEAILRAGESSIGMSTRHMAGGGNLACAEVLSSILNGNGIPMKNTASTNEMYHYMNGSKDWQSVGINNSRPGDIIITPSGSKAGHVGIIGNNDTIMSNSSRHKQFTQNYTINSWENSISKRNPGTTKVFRYTGN